MGFDHAVFYMHLLGITAPGHRATARLLAALRPGGLLDLSRPFQGPEKFMFQPNELLRDFPDLRVLRYEDTEGEAGKVGTRPAKATSSVLSPRRRE